MDKRESPAEKEYWRRINVCAKAIRYAARFAGLEAGVTGEYQGCEMTVPTEVYADAKVVVLMGTGHAPRLPKYITLTVHGVIWQKINGKVSISGGGLGKSQQRFLPDDISYVWLKNAIITAANAVRDTCTEENMDKLRAKALAKRRQDCKERGDLARFGQTHLDV
jgi:hypothetical protein